MINEHEPRSYAAANPTCIFAEPKMDCRKRKGETLGRVDFQTFRPENRHFRSQKPKMEPFFLF